MIAMTDRNQDIIARWNAGATMGEIGAAMGLNRCQVGGVLNRARAAGIAVRDGRDVSVPRAEWGKRGEDPRALGIISLWQAGRSYLEIGEATGLSHNQIAGILKEARKAGQELRRGASRPPVRRQARREPSPAGTKATRPLGEVLRPEPVTLAPAEKFHGKARPIPEALVSVLGRRAGQCAFTCDAWDLADAPPLERIRFCAAPALPDSLWCRTCWPWAAGGAAPRRAA